MSVTPDFVGQKFTDTNTGNVWNANSTTAGDWGLQVQDAKITWLPKTQLLTGKLPFVVGVLNEADALTGITDVVLPHITIPWIYISTCADLVSLDTPSLTTVFDGDPATGYGIRIGTCPGLTSLLHPLLATCQNPIYIRNCASLASLSLPSLVSIPNSASWESFNIQNSAAFTSLSIPVFVPENDSTFILTGCPITAATVNHILARHVANAGYVSGSISLSGAAPTGQGIVDKATLIGRGVSVTTN